jgi:hypothetical protein
MKIEIELPFAGFYETMHDSEIDRAIEDGFNYDHESGDEKELPDNFWDVELDVVDFGAIRKEYCERYTEEFGKEYELDLEYVTMTSPREYNFQTDRIFANVSAEQFNIKVRVFAENHPDWAEYIRDKYTSRDGFWSFFEPDCKDEQWTRDVLEPVQYCSMLEFWIKNIENEGSDESPYGLEWNLIEDINCYEFDSIAEAHEAIEKKLKEVTNE